MQFAALIQHQHGVFTRAQARDAGFTDRQITRRLRRGVWRQYFPGLPGVLADAGLPLTYRSRLWATTLATGPPMALGVQTAAALCRWCPTPAEIEVVVPRSRRVTPPPHSLVRRVLPDNARFVRRDGLPVTPPALTLSHCLRFLPLATARDILDRSQQVGGPPLEAVAHELGPRGPGTAQARRLLGAADGSHFAAERLAVRLLREAGITGFRVNARVSLPGLVAVIDIAFVELGIAIEIDGFAFHVDPDRFQSDRRRQNALMRAGWLVLRFTWADLTERPADVVRLVGEAVHARQPA
jgi:very-short-patch-repair endonuclease